MVPVLNCTLLHNVRCTANKSNNQGNFFPTQQVNYGSPVNDLGLGWSSYLKLLILVTMILFMNLITVSLLHVASFFLFFLSFD